MQRRTLLQRAIAPGVAGLLGFNAAWWSSLAQAQDSVRISQAFFPSLMVVNGRTLVFNGGGVRHRAFIQLYAVALYLPRKSNNVEEILAMPGEKHIQLVALRIFDFDVFAKMMTKGMTQNNDKFTMQKLLPDLIRLSQLFGDSRYAMRDVGDSISITHIPGEGPLLRSRGEMIGRLNDADFFQALIRLWLGANPVEAKLKNQMLGLEPPV